MTGNGDLPALAYEHPERDTGYDGVEIRGARELILVECGDIVIRDSVRVLVAGCGTDRDPIAVQSCVADARGNNFRFYSYSQIRQTRGWNAVTGPDGRSQFKLYGDPLETRPKPEPKRSRLYRLRQAWRGE